MQIVLIINIILLFGNFILMYQTKKIKFSKTEQKNKIQQEITLLKLQQQQQLSKIALKRQELNNLLDQIKETIKKEQDNVNNYYKNIKEQASKSFESYCDKIDECYFNKEKQYQNKITKIKQQHKQVETQLIQIKNIYNAATAARIRQQEEQDKRKFYQLQIPNKQILDIKKLEKWKQQLNDPSIVSKIIWSSYIMKPTSDLCNRIIGSSATCGIYKITNILSNEIYIGQSVNIADRWKQHIKCGLGIDASSTNKLYNNMQENGVWNFSFEILQKCSREKLNEKERFWIEMYQSNKIGMNLTKGNK